MNRKLSTGFTLIELMVAVVIGIILLLGIAVLFTNTTNNIRLQRGIATMQENGRVLSEFFKQDISGAGSQYCATMSSEPSVGGHTPRRPILNEIIPGITNGNDEKNSAYTTNGSGLTGGTFYGLPGIIDQPAIVSVDDRDKRNSKYISPRFLIQGHNCVGVTCTPLLTVLGAARTETGQTAAPNVASPVVGNRVPNSDVLTVRTLVGSGASISGVTASRNGFVLAPGSAQRTGLLGLDAGRHANRLVLVTDCTVAAMYRGSFDFTTNTLNIPTPLGVGNNFTFGPLNTRVFDMENQWLTVTYYLQFVADPNTTGRIIPALMRRENGRNPEELARGIERLDFRYSVTVGDSTADETSRWLTAAEVQNRAAGTIPCPITDVSGYGTLDKLGTWDPTNSCLWTSVQAIEVGYSVTSIERVANSDDRTSYSMENELEVVNDDGMLHREFRVLIPIRAWSR